MTETEKALKDFEHYREFGYSKSETPSSQSLEIALTALREKAERENPKPLMWDELTALEGKPVYIKMITDSKKSPSCWAIVGKVRSYGGWHYVDLYDGFENESWSERKYGHSWVAYASEPICFRAERSRP